MYDSEPMQHANVKPAPPTVHNSHPFKSQKNHKKLLKYVQARLLLGKNSRDARITRFAEIDKAVAGWMQLDPEDKKRLEEKRRTGKPSPTNMNIPLTFVHLDDMITYYAHTFCPSRGMFYHTSKPDEVHDAAPIVTLMNNHSIYAGWYREVLLTLNALMRYNLGGFHCFWGQDQGPKLEKDNEGRDVLKTEVKWQGNKLESLDMYNLIWDPSVHPSKLHSDGEFAAKAFIRGHYWLRHKASLGVYHNVEKALDGDRGISDCVYYRSPPKEANFEVDESRGGDYRSWFTEAPDYAANSGFELVEVYIRLNPVEFGLIDGPAAQQKLRDRYEVWRVTILNDEFIIDTAYMNNIHGFIPIFLTLVNDDLMASAQKSVAEILTPLQDFASFLVNVHMKASRKNLWGKTYYDPSMVDLNSVPEGEVAANVPVKATAYGKDIRSFVFRDSDRPLETKQTLQDLEGIMGIINQFFPTQSLPSQIASIDRAVDSQVAAVQQGSNRRLHKTARLLDDTLFRWVRFCCYYNIIQYQPDNSTVNDFHGKAIPIDLSKLRATDLPFIIGQGLKAIDRQAASQSLERIIFALIQNPQAAAQFRLADLIDYWTSMIDIDVDMKQFRAEVAVDPNTGQPVTTPGVEPAQGEPTEEGAPPA